MAGRYVIDRGMVAGNADTVNRYFFAFLGAAGVDGRVRGAARLPREPGWASA